MRSLLMQVPQLDLHRLAQFHIERRERFVEQQHLGVADDGARQRHALALTAGQLHGAAVRLVQQVDAVEGLAHPRRDLTARDARYAQAVAHVLLDGHVRKQRVVLENRVDLAPVGRVIGHVAPVQHDAAGIGGFKPGDQPQHGGLAATRRPEQGDELALLQRKGHIVDGDDAARKRLRQVLDFQNGHSNCSPAYRLPPPAQPAGSGKGASGQFAALTAFHVLV